MTTTEDYPNEPICELWLCESRHLGLKPNQIYLFRINPDCADCKQVALEVELKGPTE